MLLSLRFLPITSLAVASSAFTLPQQASATTESQLIFQDSDYVYMKVCLDTSTSTYVEKTPFQCTNPDGSSTYQLVDPTTSTPIMYFHSNYAPTWENWISYCEKTYGQQREYSFPLSTIGADNKGNNYTLMVHWLSEVSSEYMSGGSDKNCMLNSEVTHTKSATTLSGVDDGYGVLTIYNEPSSMGNSYGTHSYMTLLGENLPATVNTAAASDLLYYDGLPLARAFGITLGNGYTTNNKPPAYSPGIQNFNNGWAHDLSLSAVPAGSAVQYNMILLGKKSISWPTGYTPDVNSSNDSIVPVMSVSVNFPFTYGPGYGAPYTSDYPPPTSGLPVMQSIMQFGFFPLYNNDAPQPYTGPGTGAGISEHIYSTREYGYATRWEGWSEADLDPTTIPNAQRALYGQECSPPASPWGSSPYALNSDFTYGPPKKVYVPVAYDPTSADHLSYAVAGATAVPGPAKIFLSSNGEYYGTTSYLPTQSGNFQVAGGGNVTPAVIYFPYPNKDNVAGTYVFNGGIASYPELVADGKGGVYLGLTQNIAPSTTLWYQWNANSNTFTGPVSWTPPNYQPTAQAWAQEWTVNGTTNVWYMFGCTDYSHEVAFNYSPDLYDASTTVTVNTVRNNFVQLPYIVGSSGTTFDQYLLTDYTDSSGNKVAGDYLGNFVTPKKN